VLGDEDGGATVRLGTRDVTDQNELLVVAAGLLDRPELQRGPAADATSLAWWMLDDEAWRRVSTSRPGIEPPRSFSLGAAGYYGARDDWSEGAWYCTVDAGPHGGDATGHAHTDLGHVEIARGAHWLTVDPGCPVYTSEPERRNWFRSQRAHATLQIDDTEVATPSSAFGWRRVGPTPAAQAVEHGTYWACSLTYAYPIPDGTLEHERQVVLVRSGGVIVCDFVRGGGEHAVVTRWPLGVREADARLESEACRLTVNASRVSWAMTGPRPRASIGATRRSPRFGVEADASALVLSANGVRLPWRSAVVFTDEAGAPPQFDSVGDGFRVTISRVTPLGPVIIELKPRTAPTLVTDGS
jgi:hypothetical protein